MKSIKVFLIIVSLLLILGIGFGIYVWVVFQQTQNQLNEQGYSAETATMTEGGVQTEEDDIVTTIEVSTLPDAQQSAIKTLGFEGDAIVITEDMISCAEDAVGKERLDEIIGGVAPTPLESLQLLPCFKK